MGLVQYGGVPARDQKINPNTVLPSWPLRCNKGAIFHPRGLFRASHPMNKPSIFKLADLLALQVIALVYQCSTQFITYSSTSRILVLMSSVRRQESRVFVFEIVCTFMRVALQIKKSKRNDPSKWNYNFITSGWFYISTRTYLDQILTLHFTIHEGTSFSRDLTYYLRYVRSPLPPPRMSTSGLSAMLTAVALVLNHVTSDILL